MQRRLAGQKSGAVTPLHIPLARHETGTTQSSIDKNGYQDKAKLGSLSYDVNTLVKGIIRRADITEAGTTLKKVLSSGEKKDAEAVAKLFDRFYQEVSTVLDSEEVHGELDATIAVIREQGSRDDMASPDWNMVYESAKKHIQSAA